MSGRHAPQNRELTLKAEFHNDEGTHKFQFQNNIEGAILSYTKAIDLDPTHHVYYNNRAAAYNEAGQFECAIKDCDVSIGIRDNRKAYSNCPASLCFRYRTESDGKSVG